MTDRSPTFLPATTDTQFATRRRDTPVAWIYNAYFDTAGGGERSTLIFAKALEELGYDLIFVSTNPCRRGIGCLLALFQIELLHLCEFLVFESEAELGAAMAEAEVDLFLNHTYGSSMPNTAGIGLYLTMFPHEIDAEAVSDLKTYHSILVISPFVEWNARIRWGEQLTYELVWIPLAERGAPPVLNEKEKLILNVGRFNVFGHNKCQKEAIEHFLALVERGALDSSWRMVVAGVVNESPETNAYVDACRTLARKGNVEILTDVSTTDLYELYRRAAYFWQFTGVGLEFGQTPEHCEHLGLVTLDCFASGVVPVAYHRGGVSGIIEYGMNGYLFGNLNELSEIMRLQADVFHTSFHERLYQESLRSAGKYSFAELKRTLFSVLNRIGPVQQPQLMQAERYGTR